METITVTQPVPDISGNAFLPPVALVPFRQDSHDSAHPVVTEGTRVKEGQLIARGTAPATSRIHAPVPGMIRSFKKISCPDGGTSTAAEILLSGSFDILGRKEENFSWKTSPESEIIRILEDKGVVSTFEEPVPLVELIRDAKKQKKPVILVRLFDLDPTCQLDSILFKEFPDKVVEGAALIAKALNIRSLYFVTDQDLDTGAITRAAEPIEAVILKTDTRYPSGNRKQLVKILPEAEQNRPGFFLIRQRRLRRMRRLYITNLLCTATFLSPDLLWQERPFSRSVSEQHWRRLFRNQAVLRPRRPALLPTVS